MDKHYWFIEERKKYLEAEYQKYSRKYMDNTTAMKRFLEENDELKLNLFRYFKSFGEFCAVFDLSLDEFNELGIGMWFGP